MKVIYPESGTTTVGGTGDVSYKAGDVVITNSANQPANSILATGQTINGNNYPDLTALNNYPSVGNLSNVNFSNGVDLGNTIINSSNYHNCIFKAASKTFAVIKDGHNTSGLGVDIYKIDTTNNTFTLLENIEVSSGLDNVFPKAVVRNDNEVLITFDFQGSDTKVVLFNPTTETLISSVNNSPIIDETNKFLATYNKNLSKYVFISSSLEVYTSPDGINWSLEVNNNINSFIYCLNDKNYYMNKYYFQQIDLPTNTYKIISINENDFSLITEELDFSADVDTTGTYNVASYTCCQINNNGQLLMPIQQDSTSNWNGQFLNFNLVDNTHTVYNFNGSSSVDFELFYLLNGKTLLFTDQLNGQLYVSYDALETSSYLQVDGIDEYSLRYSKPYLGGNLLLLGYFISIRNNDFEQFTYDQSQDVILPNLKPLSSGDGKTNGYLIHTN